MTFRQTLNYVEDDSLVFLGDTKTFMLHLIQKINMKCWVFLYSR